MAKMYYSLEEALGKLGLSEEKLKALVREGKLREFRDAGKLNYRVDEVDRLAGEQAAPLSLEDSGGIPLAPEEEDTPLTGSKPPGKAGGSGSTLGLGLEEGSGEFKLSDSGDSSGLSLSDSGGSSGDLSLEDSGGGSSGGISLEGSGSGSGVISLEDSGGGSGAPAAPAKGLDRRGASDSGGDIVSLEEVDKSAVEGMKKDDTVITNIGISVFDDDDLEIAADPMAKTLMTGGDEHLGLDGSGGGSGLLELTRESDDTSLGAELLEGIDMGDTAETAVSATGPTTEEAAPVEPAEVLPVADETFAPAAVAVPMVVGTVEAASPAFTGLLVAGTLVMGLLAAANIAMAVGVCPAYLLALSEQFWFFLPGCLLAGGAGAGIGWFVGKQASKPRVPKPPKEKTGKADKKAAKGQAAGAAPR